MQATSTAGAPPCVDPLHAARVGSRPQSPVRQRGRCPICYRDRLRLLERAEPLRFGDRVEQLLLAGVRMGQGPVPAHAPTLGPCSPWIGSGRDSEGYAQIWCRGRARRVHRLVWAMTLGPIPPGHHIDHLCHHPDHCRGVLCPHRLCEEQWHMAVVPLALNTAPGRSNSLTALNAVKTHCLRGHQLTGRDLIVRGDGRRECRRCKLLRAAGRLPGSGQVELFGPAEVVG